MNLYHGSIRSGKYTKILHGTISHLELMNNMEKSPYYKKYIKGDWDLIEVKWVNTTTKDGKIFNDMFITDSRGRFQLVEVREGEMYKKIEITLEDKNKIIKENNLIRENTFYKDCYTYRKEESIDLILELLQDAYFKNKIIEISQKLKAKGIK